MCYCDDSMTNKQTFIWVELKCFMNVYGGCGDDMNLTPSALPLWYIGVIVCYARFSEVFIHKYFVYLFS